MEQSSHDLEKSFAQSRRSVFGSPTTFVIHSSGLIHARINACKGCNRRTMIKTRNIAYLSHTLGPVGGAYAIHGHNGLIFRKRRSKLIHGTAKNLDLFRNRIQLLNAAENQLFVDRIFRNNRYKVFRGFKKLLGLIRLKVISMMLTEVLVAFCESFQTNLANTVCMPERMDVINPFFTSVRANRTFAPG